jgi:hypothetical protein
VSVTLFPKRNWLKRQGTCLACTKRHWVISPVQKDRGEREREREVIWSALQIEKVNYVPRKK